MLACELGASDDIILLLLDAGCDITAQDVRGRKGIIIARQAGHGDDVKNLIEGAISSGVLALQKSGGLAEDAAVPKIKDTFRWVASSERSPTE